ncbi:hypothetical protein CEP54_012575 [Fusarium duplospermum]|uniref:Uncharacterized protein n=1 Tax=Fusarium duplospermum TaxID=1325734 RepID=A0A428P828_9HYPO|nr:hypothetical protein CEP54_012575 [Fusarium duplospermum]
MKLQISLFTVLFILQAIAVHPPLQPCGSGNPPDETLEAARSLTKRHASTESRSATSQHVSKGIVVPTYLHVIESKKKAGLVTDEMLHDQVSPSCLHTHGKIPH